MTTIGERTVAITGTTGYLGGLVRDRLTHAGWETISLVRNPSDDRARRYRIDEALDPHLLEGADALVHCAYDMQARTRSDVWRINVDGTRQLLDLASRTVRGRVIVMSSMSAYEGTKQLYGMAKLAVEEEARRHGAVAVRPGLVYGPRAGGMAGSLASMTRLPIVPVVAARSHQFTVHEADFADAIAALLDSDSIILEPIGIANPVPVPFRSVIEGLGRQRGRSCRTAAVDWRLLHAVLRASETIGINLPFRADSVLGLARPAPSVPNLKYLDRLGIALRRFDQPTIAVAR